MYPILPTETLIETKTCRHCGVSFSITDKDIEFYDKVSPSFGGVKYQIPTPTLCPDCRLKRRLSFRNERTLYKRKCNATQKDIISVYSPDKSYKVYHQDYWWSDKWDAMDYGNDFDFNKSFFEQFEDLIKNVPSIALWAFQWENAEYNNNCYKIKNSYMSYNSDLWEEYYYSYITENSNRIFDSSYIYNCENCYQCTDLTDSFNCYFSSSITDSSDCYFSSNLTNCKFCFWSHWLTNAEYVWFNKRISKDEWLKLFTENFISENVNENINKSKKINLKVPKKYANIINCENCVGDYIWNSKNIQYSYGIQKSENIKYTWYVVFWVNDVYDSYALWDVKLSYEANEWWVNISRSAFIKNSMEWLEKSFYTFFCWHNSSNLFWCIGLKNKSYCILNKQYTKEEYEALAPKIIEHMRKAWEWGEFFPSSISPFGYNETVAQEYFPMTRTDAINCVSPDNKPIFNWSDYEAPFPRVEKVIPAAKLPEDIVKIPDDILNWAIECEVTGKPFRIIKQELEFYRKHNLPIPRRHPDQRHLDRMALRNPRKLYERRCDKCEKDMMTTYSPERPERVYCETCYNKEIY
ncbi:MAG: hypothetical protein ACD_71C00073G0001 [uncultured bacterium (gcode 4)]|uniref:Uncharacterized protein n=1 Tax=uncultured bacterium (gcode 4) TaxID=1234023 RepID=K2A3K4_9BACT|nr:MAG: hypothetical protein ACD_71C00073G0001 [uncultured bacterium (gcode 4)]